MTKGAVTVLQTVIYGLLVLVMGLSTEEKD